MNELGKNAGDKADHNGPQNAHGCPTPFVFLRSDHYLIDALLQAEVRTPARHRFPRCKCRARHGGRKFRKVMGYRRAVTAGMLCSPSIRDSPRRREADLGSTGPDVRCHPAPAFRRKRKVQDDTSEMPMTSPNTERSLCQPIAAPG